MIETFQIRTYGKAELAQLYNPNISAAGARKKLMYWINLHPTLRDSLYRMGYAETNHNFTPAQVRLIVEALGEPG